MILEVIGSGSKGDGEREENNNKGESEEKSLESHPSQKCSNHN